MLTDDQKKKIDALIKQKGAGVIGTREALDALFDDKKDTRSPEGMDVKRYLVEVTGTGTVNDSTTISLIKDIVSDNSLDPNSPLSPTVLADISVAHKRHIDNNCMKQSFEEIRQTLLYNKKKDSPEVQAAKAYYYSIDPSKRVAENSGARAKNTYTPPNQFAQTVARINESVKNVHKDKKVVTDFSMNQRREVEFVQRSLNDRRFKDIIETMDDKEDRDLFEAKFIGFIYNKPDLNEEEVNTCITLAGLIINHRHLKQEEFAIRSAYLETVNTTEDGGGIYSEACDKLQKQLKELRKLISENEENQADFQNQITIKRSERLKLNNERNASILSLIDALHEEDKRKKIAHEAILRKKLVRQELERLNSMDGLIAEIFGASMEELN